MINKQSQDRWDKKIQKALKKAKFWGYLVSILIGMGFFIYVAIKFFSWTNTHVVLFQSPVVFRSPVIVKSKVKNAQNETPVKKEKVEKTEEQIVKSQKHGEVLWKVYQLESGRGKNDYCRIQGKGYGGFGVKDDDDKIVCYPTFEQAVERAQYWLVQDGIEDDFVNGLCVYNLGGKNAPYSNCNYYQDYLGVDL